MNLLRPLVYVGMAASSQSRISSNCIGQGAVVLDQWDCVMLHFRIPSSMSDTTVDFDGKVHCLILHTDHCKVTVIISILNFN
jgi:hypothetical protein